MVHLRPIILALLLAVAGSAAAVPSSAPMAQSSTATTTDTQVYVPANTSSVLTLGEDADETRAFTRSSLDVGTTLDVEKTEMERRLTTQSSETAFSQVDSRAVKRDLLFQQATRIEDRVTALENRAQVARQSFRNGTMTAGEYVRTIVMIEAEARLLQAEVAAVEDRTRMVPQFTLTEYLSQFDKRLVSLRGPLRQDTVSSLSGADSPQRMYVSASADGVILSSIQDGVYEREVYRADHRTLDETAVYNVSQIRDRSKRLYPWAWEDGNYRGEGWNPTEEAGQMRFNLEHAHGVLNGQFDMSNGLVFRESQQKYLTDEAASRNGLESTRPKGPGATANRSGLLLTVNRSYPGGPMYVALEDNETGDYVEGTVAVGGETVGETTRDGGLWTLSPAGSFNVSASSGLDVVAVETRATRPIRNHNVTQG